MAVPASRTLLGIASILTVLALTNGQRSGVTRQQIPKKPVIDQRCFSKGEHGRTIKFISDQETKCWYWECQGLDRPTMVRCALGTFVHTIYEADDHNPCTEKYDHEGKYDCTRKGYDPSGIAECVASYEEKGTCLNGGTIETQGTLCWCQCPKDFTGWRCETAIAPYMLLNDVERSDPDSPPEESIEIGENNNNNGGVEVFSEENIDDEDLDKFFTEDPLSTFVPETTDSTTSTTTTTTPTPITSTTVSTTSSPTTTTTTRQPRTARTTESTVTRPRRTRPKDTPRRTRPRSSTTTTYTTTTPYTTSVAWTTETTRTTDEYTYSTTRMPWTTVEPIERERHSTDIDKVKFSVENPDGVDAVDKVEKVDQVKKVDQFTEEEKRQIRQGRKNKQRLEEHKNKNRNLRFPPPVGEEDQLGEQQHGGNIEGAEDLVAHGEHARLFPQRFLGMRRNTNSVGPDGRFISDDPCPNIRFGQAARDWCGEVGGCLNGGICTNQCTDFVCHCPPPFTAGKRCERYRCIENEECLNGGACSRGVLGDDEVAVCSCPRGYTGQCCEIELNV